IARFRVRYVVAPANVERNRFRTSNLFRHPFIPGVDCGPDRKFPPQNICNVRKISLSLSAAWIISAGDHTPMRPRRKLANKLPSPQGAPRPRKIEFTRQPFSSSASLTDPQLSRLKRIPRKWRTAGAPRGGEACLSLESK